MRLTSADDLHFSPDADPQVVAVLKRAYSNGLRVRIHYGTTDANAARHDGDKLGRDWGGVYDLEGTIGCSTGERKIPLLIARSTSTGGGGILTDCIVRIRHANKRDGGDLYRHPDYHLDTETVYGCTVSDRERDRHFPGWREQADADALARRQARARRNRAGRVARRLHAPVAAIA